MFRPRERAGRIEDTDRETQSSVQIVDGRSDRAQRQRRQRQGDGRDVSATEIDRYVNLSIFGNLCS